MPMRGWGRAGHVVLAMSVGARAGEMPPSDPKGRAISDGQVRALLTN